MNFNYENKIKLYFYYKPVELQNIRLYFLFITSQSFSYVIRMLT